jgi:uncharacterized protein (DUF1800 family)
MAITWNEENAAHLMRRAGFGATPKQLEAAVKAGLDKTLDGLFKVDTKSVKLPKRVESLEDLQALWLDRMIRTRSPLAEKLALFWHNHFATGFAKVKRLDYMHGQIQTLRAKGLGSFRELVLAVARDPAMILWLDNNTNVADDPNENFARELMELFTTGVLDKNGSPNYTEVDVQQAARAFTGWTIQDDAFFFDSDEHDFGSKSFQGETGPFDGDDIVNLLCVEPATARRIPALLFGFFAFEIDLDDPIADELTSVYFSNDGKIQPILDHIFRMDAFYSTAAKGARVKEPAEFLAGALRLMGGRLTLHPSGDAAGARIQALGQSLFDPPTVFGWDPGLAWVTTAGMLERASAAQWIAGAREKENPVKYTPKKLLGAGSAKIGAAEVVARVTSALGLAPAASTLAALTAYLQKDDGGATVPFVVDKDSIDKKVRGLIALALASPEFQVA